MRRRQLLAWSSTLLAVLLGSALAACAAPAAVVPVSMTLDATADSFLQTSAPEANHGRAAALRASREAYHVLLRFDLALPAGSKVTGVGLRVYVRSTSSAQLVVHRTGDGWQETTVTSGTAPARQAGELARLGPLEDRQYVSATLPTSAVPAAGPVSFGLSTAPGGVVELASRETDRRPQLVVSYEPAGSAPEPDTAVAEVSPLVENVGFPGSGDVSDDSAIWVDRSDPGNSVVIADHKGDPGGGVGVFDLRGAELDFRADGAIGNVDLRTDFPLGGRSTVLVGANNRSTDTMALWVLDPSSRQLSPVAAPGIATTAPNYGFCMYRSKVSGKFYAFVTPRLGGAIQQFELVDDGRGLVDAVLVRTLSVSSITESCVADDDLGHLYVGQEDVALWKYGAEPSAGTTAVSVDTAGGGRLAADIEGLSIAYGPGGSGYLLVSSQGDSTVAVYDRAGSNAFLQKFRVVGGADIDGVTGTDGLDVTTMDAGPGFEQGMLVVHDESNAGGTTSNLKYVPMSAVLRAVRS